MSVGSRTTAGPWTGAPELAAAIERLLDAIDQGRGADVPAALTEVDRLTANLDRTVPAQLRHFLAQPWRHAAIRRLWQRCGKRKPRRIGPDRRGPAQAEIW